MSTPGTIFYHPDYLKIQKHQQLFMAHEGAFQAAFAIRGDLAMSLPGGLFGSFLELNPGEEFSTFEQAWRNIKGRLRRTGIKRIEIVHPPEIYVGFIPEDWLIKMGFRLMYEDIDHYIPMKNFHLHRMEQRKLEKLGDRLVVDRKDLTDYREVHDFLEQCRIEQGLKINLSFSKLGDLITAFPERYDFFVGRLDGEWACAAITLKVSDQVVYYFLPGTSRKFKKESPMVGLIVHMLKEYTDRYRYFDLGVSSIEGSPQRGLVQFKERMGGIRTMKRRYYLEI